MTEWAFNKTFHRLPPFFLGLMGTNLLQEQRYRSATLLKQQAPTFHLSECHSLECPHLHRRPFLLVGVVIFQYRDNPDNRIYNAKNICRHWQMTTPTSKKGR